MNRETSNAKIIHNAESNELVATEEVTSRHAENLLEEIQHMAGFFGSCFDLLYFSLIFLIPHYYLILNFYLHIMHTFVSLQCISLYLIQHFY